MRDLYGTQIKARKPVLDSAGFTGPSLQHDELDHTDHTDHEQIRNTSALKYLDN